MDTLYKLTLFFLFIFILLNNAKADKPAANNEEIINGYSFSTETQYNLALHE